MLSRRITAILLCFAMLLCLAGCSQPSEPKTTTEPSTEPTTEGTTIPTEPADIYAAAVKKLSEVTDLELTITMDRTLTVRNETFIDSTEQTVTYQGFGTDSMTAALHETTDFDQYVTVYKESFQSGTLYTCVDETSYFNGSMTADEFMSRFAPVAMLTADLYGEITKSGTTLSFAAPLAGESWLVPDYAELITAAGTATVSDDFDLTAATYDVTYSIGGAEITYHVEMAIKTDSITMPDYHFDNKDYVTLEYVDAPRLIEQAAGFLYQAGEGHSVTTSTAESIISYAVGAIRNQSLTVNTWGAGDDYMGDVDLSLYIVSAQENFSFQQVEHFQDGVYTYATDGGEPVETEGVTAAIFQNYCANNLVGNILSPEYLTGATAEDLGSLYYLEMTASDEMGESMNQYACETLWNDENYLNDLTDSFETDVMKVYLGIDKFTGLPTAVGYYFEGNHYVGPMGYLLSVQIDQSFDLVSTSAYENLTDKAPAVEEPEEKATPLFYHVTGSDGQEMWLLGTIHVGDARTSYLPQEIYDAFDAADALAVEFNSEAFNEELENDEELSDQVSAHYFYSDGTTTADHVEDTELYEFAEKMMKASGNYHMNVPYLKATMWGNSIDNFYLRQSYLLDSTQGVDNQLIWRAQEQEKTILDVESGLFQVQMLTGFSDALQEQLLLESASTDPLESIAGTLELFEMWCAGDEAALIAYLNDEPDTSELTEEELALLDEYNNAMGTDRNDDMLNAAVDYLESGDVVFYAVGLAHLLAEDGLVNTLRDAGYTVELVSFE